MIKDMIKDIPWYFKVIWAIYFILGITFIASVIYGLWKLISIL